jgi:hypothetical protein
MAIIHALRSNVKQGSPGQRCMRGPDVPSFHARLPATAAVRQLVLNTVSLTPTWRVQGSAGHGHLLNTLQECGSGTARQAD